MAAVAHPLVEQESGQLSDSESDGEGPQLRALRRAVAVVLSFSLCVAGIAGLVAFRPRASGAANLRHRTQLWETADFSPVSDDTNTEFMDTVGGLPGIPYSEAALQELRHPTSQDSSKETTVSPPVPVIAERAQLNSNDCFEEEEFFAGACYKNCSALTNGQYPIRSSPNTCCSAEPCIFPSHISFMGPFVCTGYAVDSRGSCPRRPGKCNSDEEMYQGVCFKPCAVLTQQEFPHRTGPMTCCKYEPPCFSFANLRSEGIGPCSGYDVGGEGHDCSHEPAV